MADMRKMAAVLALCVAGSALAGCSRRNGEIISIERDVYEMASHHTSEVKRGDLQPVVKLTLKVEGYDRRVYGAAADDLRVDKVYVSVGDKVKTGDLLVSFKSDNLDEIMEDYEKQCSDNELLIEHLRRLMEIDKEIDYSSDIRMLEEDIEVAKLYIEETKAKLESYQIVAQSDGTITKIHDFLNDGYYVKARDLVTQVCGTGNYTAKTTSGYKFNVGDVYTATAGVFSYDLKITDVQVNEVTPIRTEQMLTFEPVSDMSAVSDAESLTMLVEEPVLEDVVYVEASAINKADDRYFVYVIDDRGFRQVAWVQIGEMVDSYRIITDGLEGGEKVCLD